MRWCKNTMIWSSRWRSGNKIRMTKCGTLPRCRYGDSVAGAAEDGEDDAEEDAEDGGEFAPAVDFVEEKQPAGKGHKGAGAAQAHDEGDEAVGIAQGPEVGVVGHE